MTYPAADRAASWGAFRFPGRAAITPDTESAEVWRSGEVWQSSENCRDLQI